MDKDQEGMLLCTLYFTVNFAQCRNFKVILHENFDCTESL